LRLPRDLRPHCQRRGGARARRRRRPSPGRGDRGGERAARAVPGSARHRVRHPPRRLLDLPDDVLAELEWVQASVHGGQRGSREELTKRVLTALDSPYVSCLSHPTGRLINHRPPNAVDLEAVFARLVETGRAVEVNGLPDRLDLRDEHVRLAREAGVAIVVNTDAHSTRGLGNMELSVRTARRGWAEPGDIVNTRPLDDVLARRFGTGR